MKHYLRIVVIFCCYIGQSCAMFCPGNFNSISVGDTIAQVKAQCGKPTAEKVYQSTENLPQQWDYFLNLNLNEAALNPALELNLQEAGTVKVTMAFVDNKLINMSANGVGLGSTSICGTTIQLGNSMATIKKACGNPTFITKANTETLIEQGRQPNIITELRYDGPHPAILVFENGRLKAT